MTQAINLHTHLAPRQKLRRLTEEEKVSLLQRAQEELQNGEVKLAVRLIEEVIEAIRT
jgi:predicted DNA binding CopG/RHH family protein